MSRSRIRSRSRSGVVSSLPWYTLGKADDTNPSFWADFANNRYAVNGAAEAFSDIFTFTRSTTGTYFDANGVMQTAAINTPRFDHNPLTGEKLGLLIEEQRTNLVFRSGDIAGYWGKDNVTATYDGTLAPDGLPAAKITTVNLLGNRAASPNGMSLTATTYAVSVFIKPDTSRVCQLELDFANPNTQQTIDFDNLTSNDVAVGNGWYRCTRYFTQTGASGGARMSIRPSLTIGGSIYASLAQVEQGSFATSYIPTTSSAVTRSADVANVTSSNVVPFASWYNHTEGTFYADFLFYGSSSAFPRIFEVGDGGSNVNSISLFQTTSINQGGFNIYSGSAYQGFGLGNPDLRSTRNKFAGAIKLNNSAAGYNGSIGGTDNAILMPTGLVRMDIGNRSSGTASASLHLRELRYYSQRVTNSELQRITT